MLMGTTEYPMVGVSCCFCRASRRLVWDQPLSIVFGDEMGHLACLSHPLAALSLLPATPILGRTDRCERPLSGSLFNLICLPASFFFS